MSDRDGSQPARRTATRTAVFGGSFDPVHLGHLFVADEVLNRFEYERVIFVPAHIAPHKGVASATASDVRLRMLALAIEGYGQLELETTELDRGGISFTIDTIRYLIESGSVAGRPGLIVGADLVDGFESWREVDEIERLADIILVRRPGFTGVEFARRHRTMDNLELDISSREIRQRIRAGRPYRFLLPHKVVECIELNGLYR